MSNLNQCWSEKNCIKNFVRPTYKIIMEDKHKLGEMLKTNGEESNKI